MILLGTDVSGHPPPPETTGDYVILYAGLAIVLAAVLFLVIRAWRNRTGR